MAISERLDDWARQVVDAVPEFDSEARRIAVHAYHLLSRGEPVSTDQIGDAVRLPTEHVEERLRSWPLVLWDDQGRVIGFFGLHVHHIKPTHAIDVGNTTVYGWCAGDTLIITEILGQETTVESIDPHDGTPINLTVTPTGVTSLQPPKAVMSLLFPQGGLEADDIQRFCHQVHFFSSSESADEWMADRPDMFSLTVDEFFEVGQAFNRYWLGAAINEINPRSAPT